MLTSNTLFSYFNLLAYFKELTTMCFYYFKSLKNYLAETCSRLIKLQIAGNLIYAFFHLILEIFPFKFLSVTSFFFLL